ncbi:hypothetical protein BC628DRAFT_1027018 [Trametes gibbosa]|nr:hypothetical protein BC628DRAFT_1027018 [Trametes gibbosa]
MRTALCNIPQIVRRSGACASFCGDPPALHTASLVRRAGDCALALGFVARTVRPATTLDRLPSPSRARRSTGAVHRARPPSSGHEILPVFGGENTRTRRAPLQVYCGGRRAASARAFLSHAARRRWERRRAVGHRGQTDFAVSAFAWVREAAVCVLEPATRARTCAMGATGRPEARTRSGVVSVSVREEVVRRGACGDPPIPARRSVG